MKTGFQFLFWFVIAIIAIGLTGCSSWYHLADHTKKPESHLPPPRIPKDSVTLDVAFLRLSDVSEAEIDSAWKLINEQAIDIEVRRRLDVNGIRAGVIQGEIPGPVQRWLDQSSEKLKNDFLEQADVVADVTSLRQRLLCRQGKRKELVVRPQRPGQLILMHQSKGLAKGKTYDDPMLMLELKTFPQSDGSVRIKLTPEVQHGPPITNHFAKDGDFHLQRTRAQDQWLDAAIEAQLNPMSILMISGTEQSRGLGEQFFWTDTIHQVRERVVLLVRLSGNQSDDLFGDPLPPEADGAADK